MAGAALNSLPLLLDAMRNNARNNEQEREQERFNMTMAGRASLLEERAGNFMADQRTHNDLMTNRTNSMSDKIAATSGRLDLMDQRAKGLDNDLHRTFADLRRVEDREDAFRRDQDKKNMEFASRESRLESGLDLVNSRADGMLNDFNKFSSTVGRVEDKIEKNRADQCEFNMAISKQGAQLEERQNQFQATVNSRTNELQYVQQKLQGELTNTSVKVGVIEYRTGDMQQEQKVIHDKQNDITMNMQQISTKLNFHEKSFDAVQQDQRTICDKLVAVSAQCEKLQASQEKLQDRMNTMQKESDQQLRLICFAAALLIALIAYLFKLVISK